MAKSQFDIDNNSNAQPEGAANAASTAYVAKANDTVTIADPSPVIILFGSGASGKTMTLIRLTKYLIQQGYKVQPERTFRDARDTHYQNMCNNFTSIVNNTKAPGSNAVIDFMLVKVMDKWGRPICQLLEAPGEHYFDPFAPKRPFPAYINTISQGNNRRTWVFIVEKDWMNQSDRNNFAQKICDLQQQYVLTRDKVIFTCHKADLHPQYMVGGSYNVPLFFNDIQNQYPNIFSKYENTNPITKLWRKYNFDFIVFSAGSFSDDDEGGQNYVPSNMVNPALLWKSILKTVKGGW
jgi:GTPase SAR1 family protein